MDAAADATLHALLGMGGNLDFEPPIADGDLPDDLQIFGPYGNLNCGSFEWDPNFLFPEVELTAQIPGYTVEP